MLASPTEQLSTRPPRMLEPPATDTGPTRRVNARTFAPLRTRMGPALGSKHTIGSTIAPRST
jgi:hypothetical protein